LSWEVVVNPAESVVQALDIEVRYKISFWHALILQAAESPAPRYFILKTWHLVKVTVQFA
jgi:predicted nucleic acid-binding protein